MPLPQLLDVSIDWVLCDTEMIQHCIRPWIDRNICEIFGSEEAGSGLEPLLLYLCAKLKRNVTARVLLSDSAIAVMDDIGPDFVSMMYRVIILMTTAKRQGFSPHDTCAWMLSAESHRAFCVV